MDIYIAVCIDHHCDDDIKVFTNKDKAIDYCEVFLSDKRKVYSDLTQPMIDAGWVFYAGYGYEGDSVRVEKGVLDPE